MSHMGLSGLKERRRKKHSEFYILVTPTFTSLDKAPAVNTVPHHVGDHVETGGLALAHVVFTGQVAISKMSEAVMQALNTTCGQERYLSRALILSR